MNLREMKNQIMLELAWMTWENPVYSIQNLHNLNYKTLQEYLKDKLEIKTDAQEKRFEEAIYQVQKTLGR